MDDAKLEEIFGKPEEKPQAQPLPPQEDEQKKLDEEAQKKQEHLANLNKAIAEANETLKKTRKQAKKPQEQEEEEIPKIDYNDPSSKAWKKEINDSVSPLQTELEKEKQEIRSFAIKRFLEDKPSLVQNPEGLKKVMETYDRIKTASERTVEGVLIDLDKAYAAENHEELLTAANQRISSKAKAEEEFSSIAVSRGSTAYPTQRTKNPPLSDDDKVQLQKWGMTEQEYFELKKKYPG